MEATSACCLNQAEFAEVLRKVDVLITPTLPIVANDIGDDTVDLHGGKVDLINNIIRFTGPAFREGKVLNVGYAVEQFNLMEGKKPEILLAS